MEGLDPARLRDLTLFAGVADESLSRVASHASEFEAPAGHVLMEIGRPGSGLCVLEAGEVDVDLPGGRSIRLGPGEFFGELALLTDAPHTGRVRAVTDVRCLAVTRHDFAALLESDPRIAVSMLPVLARRLVDERPMRLGRSG